MICLVSGKLSYRSPDDAERRRKAIKRKRGAKSPALSTFRCNACGHWHLGHAAKWQRRRRFTVRKSA